MKAKPMKAMKAMKAMKVKAGWSLSWRWCHAQAAMKAMKAMKAGAPTRRLCGRLGSPRMQLLGLVPEVTKGLRRPSDAESG